MAGLSAPQRRSRRDGHEAEYQQGVPNAVGYEDCARQRRNRREPALDLTCDGGRADTTWAIYDPSGRPRAGNLAESLDTAAVDAAHRNRGDW